MRKIFFTLCALLGFVGFGQTQLYHDTQGKLEISNSGQATYTLPIALPPSINSVGPTINLTYASGQNGGIAGQGWNLQGISYIARMATRMDIDGMRDGVDFDDNDKLALDGQRLLLKTGTYWADGSTYETEVQSNTRIELKINGNNTYFVVTAPDGSRSWYGSVDGTTTTAVDISAWYIVRYEDTNGNFVLYNYFRPTNKSLCINTIQFSANTDPTGGNTAPLNKVQFFYTTAARTEKAYFKGQLVERNELLNNIKVFTKNNGSDVLFREYVIAHYTDPQLGYQRIQSITEKNGSGETANPVIFEYDTTISTNVNSESRKYYNNNITFNNAQLGGDFDGDGRLDFIADNKLYTKVFEGNSGNTPINVPGGNYGGYVINTIKNNKLNQKNSLVKFCENCSSNSNEIFFNVYDLNNSSNTFELNYTKGFTFSTIPSNYYPSIFYNLIGDFDGDGVTDLLFKLLEQDRLCPVNTNPYYDPGPCNAISVSTARLLSLSPNSPTDDNSKGCINIDNSEFSFESNNWVGDFNGDGKSDILSVATNNNAYKVYTINYMDVAPFAEFIKIGEGTIPQLTFHNPIGTVTTLNKQLFLGDFNGDGKTDLLLPNVEGNGCEDHDYCDDWTIYFSNPKLNGGEMFEARQFDITRYMPLREGYTTQTITNNYYVLDTNKDGKSDLVRIERAYYKPAWTINDHDTRWTVNTYINNIGKAGVDGFQSDYTSETNHNSDNNWFPIPIVSNFMNRGLDNELVMVQEQNNSLTYINFFKDFGRDNNLKRVTQSAGGIVDEIYYNTMEPSTTSNNLGLGTNFYSSTDSVTYPYIELTRNPQVQLVRQIKNTTLGNIKVQNFKYCGYVMKLDGVGTIGFKKTARTSWYNSTSPYVTWFVTENDPVRRGALLKTYSLQLPLATSFDFTANYTNLISKTENTYTQSAPNVFPYWLLLDTQTTTDYLTNVVKKVEYLQYTSPYFLPRQVKNSNFLGSTLHGSTLTVTEFDTDLTPTNYHIGRPTETTTTSTVYVNTPTSSPDTKTVNEKLFYDTKGNVTRTEKKANNDAVSLIEEQDYYPNGLLWKKRIKQTGFVPESWDTSNGTRETVYTYDTTNRFVKTITDPEGLVNTNDTYHPIYGLVTSQTNNALALSSSSTYDNWGKRTQVIDPYGVKTNYAYARTNNIYRTTTTVTNSSNVSDGSESFIEQNVLAQEVRKGSKDINGNWVYVATEYDYLGRKTRVSEPYFGTTTPSQWNTVLYDNYSRPITNTAYTGKVINTSYNGLTATVSDSVLTKTKTTNANGVVITATDSPGGTITFMYDAMGNMVKNIFEGITTTLTYDNWGRKTSLNDPSADALYEYKYNAYGESIYEKTPKGETKLILSSLGRLTQKIETGDNTTITSTYNYNATTKLLENTQVLNPNNNSAASTYANTYDTKKRLYKTVETLKLQGNVTATFTKQLTFDAYNRINTEASTNAAHGKSIVKTITHTYKNGYKWQLKDGTTTVWQVNTNDARGNVLSANLGNGIAVTNTFDNYGYATQYKHDLGTANIMTLHTTFEPILGNLTERYNSLFDARETFTYDALDRLTAWDTPDVVRNIFNFNTTDEGFLPIGNATAITELRPGSTTDKQLKIHAVDFGSGVTKVIATNAVAGNKINIKGKYTKINGNDVILQIKEEDANGESAIIDLGVLTGTNFSYDYTYTLGGTITLLTDAFCLDCGVAPLTSTSTNYIDTGTGTTPPGGGTTIPLSNYYLDNIQLTDFTLSIQNYDTKGRISYNNLGAYTYDANKPYRNKTINAAPRGSQYTIQSSQTQSIVYNAFKLPVSITMKNTSNVATEIMDFLYNGDHERCAAYWGSTATDKLARPNRRYYSADGSMEVNLTFVAGNTTTPATVELFTYIGGDAYSAVAVNKITYNTATPAGSGGLFYLHRDYQGSIMAITNSTGAVVEKRLYDPWGAIKQVQDGAGNVLAKMQFFERGYTGHEHLQSVGLIHMNARLYDANLHRFLSPDTYIQDPYNTQNYNRYGYCVNNPLKYTDVTGNIFGIDDIVISAVIIGAIIGAGSYTLNALLNDVPFSLGGLVQNIAVSAVTSAVTAGIAQGFGAICNFSTTATGFWSGAVVGSSTGFVTGVAGSAINTLMSGGSIKLGQLLMAGAIGAVVGGVLGGVQGQKNMNKCYNACKKIGVLPNDPVPATDEFLCEAQQNWFPDAPMENVINFSTENVSPGAQAYFEKNPTTLAVTSPTFNKETGLLTGQSSVYFNTSNTANAFSSAKQLYFTMGHEFVHVSQYATLIGVSRDILTENFRDMLEYWAYSYQRAELGDTFNGTKWTPEIIRNYSTMPYFYEMNYINFKWTNNANFIYPFK